MSDTLEMENEVAFGQQHIFCLILIEMQICFSLSIFSQSSAPQVKSSSSHFQGRLKVAEVGGGNVSAFESPGGQ